LQNSARGAAGRASAVDGFVLPKCVVEAQFEPWGRTIQNEFLTATVEMRRFAPPKVVMEACPRREFQFRNSRRFERAMSTRPAEPCVPLIFCSKCRRNISVNFGIYFINRLIYFTTKLYETNSHQMSEFVFVDRRVYQ
jgi:hypothetical protein